jgi:hypothetical protein
MCVLLYVTNYLNTLEQNKRKRDGYEEGTTILFKKSTVQEFLDAENPIAVLADGNQIYFGENDKEYSSPIFHKDLL